MTDLGSLFAAPFVIQQEQLRAPWVTSPISCPGARAQKKRICHRSQHPCHHPLSKPALIRATPPPALLHHSSRGQTPSTSTSRCSTRAHGAKAAHPKGACPKAARSLPRKAHRSEPAQHRNQPTCGAAAPRRPYRLPGVGYRR